MAALIARPTQFQAMASPSLGNQYPIRDQKHFAGLRKAVWLGSTTCLGGAGGGFNSNAHGVSGDGSIVVGYGSSAAGQEAFRWAPDTGMVGLGDLDGGEFRSVAYGASDDGNVIVGYSRSSSGQEAFVWDPAHGMRSLRDILVNDCGLDLDDWTTLPFAYAISGDGTRIVGYGIHNGNTEGFLAEINAIPESSCVSLVLVGGICLALRHRFCIREK